MRTERIVAANIVIPISRIRARRSFQRELSPSFRAGVKEDLQSSFRPPRKRSIFAGERLNPSWNAAGGTFKGAQQRNFRAIRADILRATADRYRRDNSAVPYLCSADTSRLTMYSDVEYETVLLLLPTLSLRRLNRRVATTSTIFEPK